jgi:hypothetical protein
MALTRVAPAGIGSTPGTGYVIGDSFLHSRGLNATDGYYTGIVTTQSLRVIGDLEVEGTTTTLDTALTEVDKLEVGANNNTVGVAITQSGTGDILNLYDGSTEVFTVKDGGNIGIGTDNPNTELEVFSDTFCDITINSARTSGNIGGINFRKGGAAAGIMTAQFIVNTNGDYQFHSQGTERLRIDSNGRISVNSNANASDANEGAQLRVTGTPVTRNQYYSPTGDYFGSFGYTDNTYTKSWIAVDSSYNKTSAVSSGIFLSAFHSDANGSACGHTIKNERTDAGGLIFSSVHAASSTGNPAVETERLRITTTGLVGIGTNNPAQKLHIWGNSATTALSIGDNSLTEPYVLLEANATDNVSTLHSRGNHPLTFEIQQSEKVRIQNDGKVGIGTVSPTDKLSVYGGTASVWNTNTNNRVWSVGTTNGHGLMKSFRSDGEVFFRVDSNAKRVGISTDSPTHPLSSFGSGNSGGVRIENTHDTTTVSGNIASSAFPHNLILTNYESQTVGSANRMASLGFDIPTPGGSHANAIIAFQATNSSGNGDLQFWLEQNNTPTERLRITSDGKIGINDTSPENSLSIKNIGSFEGDANSFYLGSNFTGTGQNFSGNNKHAQRFFFNNAASNGYLRYENTGTTGTAGNPITWQERFRITSSGYVGIGSDNPTGRLDIQDNFENRFAIRLSNTMGNGRTYGFRSHGTNGEAFTLYHGNLRMQQWDDYQTGGNTIFYSGGSESFRVHNNGNIGIGTNNPNAPLHVATAANTNTIAIFGSTDETSGSTYQALHIKNDVASYPALVNVSSSDILDLRSAGSVQVTIDDNNNDTTKFFRVTANGSGGSGTELFRVDEDGNVGINTDNPTQTLYVNGTTRLGGGLDYGSATILNVAPGVVKWDTSGQSGGRLNADASGNWYLNNKSYPVYNNLGVNMNDIYGANSSTNNIGGWVYLGATQHSAPYPRKAYKISGPNSTSGTFVYQVWFNGDANYDWGGLYEIRINNWNESNRFTSVAVTCINGDSDGLRVYAYNDANGIWITTNAIWGSLYIRKFGYDDSQRSRGTSLCAVDNGGHLGVGDVNGLSGTIPSGYTEVHASDSGGGGYDIEANHRFGTGGN